MCLVLASWETFHDLFWNNWGWFCVSDAVHFKCCLRAKDLPQTHSGEESVTNWPTPIWVPNRKNPLSIPGQIGNIVVQNFQHVFRQLGQIRVSYYLDIGNFFYQRLFYGPKTKFGKIVFWAQIFFLTLELKSVNSISSSFGKTVKRPINHF